MGFLGMREGLPPGGRGGRKFSTQLVSNMHPDSRLLPESLERAGKHASSGR